VLARLALWTAVAAFAFFGVAYLVVPDRMTAVVGITLTSSTARADVRAVFGGLELAIAALLARLAVRGRVDEGLAAATVLFGGLAIGRVGGAALDGEFTATTLRVIGGEAFGALGCAAALLLGRRAATSA
jgi:hypothetical protein